MGMDAARMRRATIATIATITALVLGTAGAGWALPPIVDADDDRHVDTVETALGSDPNDAASTPESVALAGSCFDDLDNDGDGTVDIDDPGCTVPAPVDDKFPPAGSDVFDSSLSLDDYALDVAGNVCLVDFDASGPVAVSRAAPTGEPLPSIDVEIVAMQLDGTGTILPGSAGCPVPPGDYDLTVVERFAQASPGLVKDTTPDAATDFPADSFFDVFFDIVVDVNGFDVILPGGPPGGPAGGPVRVTNQIATLPPYHGGKNSLCYEVPGLAHEHCPKAPPDHYTCYKSKFDPKFTKREVLIQDQFDPTGSQHRVLKPFWFCAPAAKNGEPLYEETGHLKCYKVKKQKRKTTVQVQNQFGVRMVEVKKSQLLCLATAKNDEGTPTQLDDFLCYKGKFTPKPAKRDVTLVDQFGIVETKTKKPLFLCNPAAVDGSPIENRLNHLECHAIKPRKVKVTATAVNAFGTETVTTKKAVALCVPSGKNEQVTTTTTLPPGTTTTTLPGGDLLVEYGIQHDVETSAVCFKITGPPNASADVRLTGPGDFDMQVPVALDGSGMGSGQFTISQFGSYTLSAQAGSAMGSVPVNVGPGEVPCPGSTSGRAVLLDFDTGPYPATTILCLDQVIGGCVAGEDACTGDHLHQSIGLVGEGGSFPDPNGAECGHGQIIPSQSGCGPDTVPVCVS
jgi:hypothetical protein